MTDPAELLVKFVLALAVYREARGESVIGKILVAQTIENRVQDRRWPDTYRDVVLQPWQFSAFNKNDPNALLFPRFPPGTMIQSGGSQWRASRMRYMIDFCPSRRKGLTLFIR